MSRFINVLFAALVLFVPFLIAYIILAPLIKLDSKGPVIFKQERVGYKKRVFVLYKFRSMYLNNDFSHCKKEDPRVTTIGKFIRKFKIDELPQVLNVLKGDMSVVGPRPFPAGFEEGRNICLLCPKRFDVKPGLTCLSYLRIIEYEDREQFVCKTVEYDKEYIEKKSIWLDIKIIFLTAVYIIRKAF